MNYNINKKNNLGKVRKKSTVVLILIDLILIAFFFVVLRFKDDLILTLEHKEIFTWMCYASIFLLILMLFVLLVILTGPTYILQNDLQNIYYIKKHNKIIKIPVIELKKVKARVKSPKKSKREYGTLIIITTTKKKYIIKNIYNVTKVKENIMINI